MRSSIGTLALVGALAALVACSDDHPAAGASSSTRPEPPVSGEDAFAPAVCPPETTVPMTCGTVTVPLRYDDPDAGSIAIAVGLLGAADPSAGEPPVVVLGGGPGEHTLAPFAGALTPEAPFLRLADRRDVVFVDQRGVGLSQPALECPEFLEALAAASVTAEVHDAAVAGVTSCHERLVADGIDLSAFDTAANVRDLDVLRQALGYDRVALFGTSYGARLALQAARQFPDTMAAVALSSPVPAEANYLADAAESFDAALVAVGAACAAEPECNAAYPDVTDRLVRALEALEASPAMVEVTDPATGAPATVPLDGATAATALFGLFYLPDGPAVVPWLSSRLAEGDPSLLAAPSAVVPATVSHGMQFSFICAEEAVDASPGDLSPGSLGPGALLTGSAPIVGPTLWDLCDIWDVEPGAPETFEPIDTDVPLLVVTGQFDQITPPRYGAEVAAGASTAWQVQVAGAGHSPLAAAGECGVALLQAFLDDPLAEPEPGCEPAAAPFYGPDDMGEFAAAS